MKKVLLFTTIIGSSFLCSPVFSQVKETGDSLGLPGDNLNLYGVLDLFQKSQTLEEFEKKINSEDSKINNLDLNGNNKIDYISVKDHMKGQAHAIVLQVAVNEKENQDVAVIEVEKDKNGNVQIQIIGDELLYGKNYIIEPKDETSKDISEGGTPNPGYSGNTKNVTNNYYTTNNNAPSYGDYGYNWYPVNSWSIFNYLFFPSYVVYVSPWSWGYYPGYWNPWAPLFWHSYYSYNYYHHPHYYGHGHGHYWRSDHYSNHTANSFYGHRRSTSATVAQRNAKGAYNSTYSRRDLVSKEGREVSSSNGNRISNSHYEGVKANRTGSKNNTEFASKGGREVHSTLGNRISNSHFDNVRTTSRAESSNRASVSATNGNREVRQTQGNNRAGSENNNVGNRNSSSGNNNTVNRTEQRNNSSYDRQNHSDRQSGNSPSRSSSQSSGSHSGSYSAPSSGSYSAPSRSSGGSGGSSRSSGGSGGGGARSSGGGGGRR